MRNESDMDDHDDDYCIIMINLTLLMMALIMAISFMAKMMVTMANMVKIC